MTRRGYAGLLVLIASLSGCTSFMSGLGGSERYACKAPEGIACTSVSGAYANAAQGASQAAQPKGANPSTVGAFYGAGSIRRPDAAASSAPATTIRSSPRLLRVWIAPWEDSDGDLHEEAIVHVIVDTGRWLMDHVRPKTRSSVDGVAPPSPARESPSQSSAAAGSVPAGLPPPPSGEVRGTTATGER